MSRVPIQGWVSLEQGTNLLKMSGQDFQTLKRRAASRDFKPVPLGVTASMTLKNKLRTINSQNVVARVEGSDPKLKAEYVVYTAHWDHLGVGDPVNGDRIYNGAVANAVGVAGILEIARAFTKLQSPPKRSVLFVAVTAEEQGLLGSAYYTVSPLYPLAKTAAAINIDTLNVHGRTRDLTLVGYGASELDDYARDATGEQGRSCGPTPSRKKASTTAPITSTSRSRVCRRSESDEGVDLWVNRLTTANRCARSTPSTTITSRRTPVKPDWDLGGARKI